MGWELERHLLPQGGLPKGQWIDVVLLSQAVEPGRSCLFVCS